MGEKSDHRATPPSLDPESPAIALECQSALVDWIRLPLDQQGKIRLNSQKSAGGDRSVVFGVHDFSGPDPDFLTNAGGAPDVALFEAFGIS